MAVYKPTYTDKTTGKVKTQSVWWYNFTFAGRRIQESSKSGRKTIALEAEKRRRRELEQAYAGIPSVSGAERVTSVAERIATYLESYPSSHRKNSVVFATTRLAHVERLLGKCLQCDLTEQRVQDYIRARLAEEAGGRTINMEVGELSRAMKFKWSVSWPSVRKLEENQDVGRALSPDEEKRLLQAAADDDSPNRNPMLYTFIRLAPYCVPLYACIA
ncbi:MAG: hypothetical protein ABI824_19260, partial [Acidobacteriota bacterium]